MIQPTKPTARIWRPNILIFGDSGTGKTKTWLDLMQLTGARALCVDTHNGTNAWVRTYPEGWDVVHSDSPDEIEEQIDYRLQFPGDYTMFVVDDWSVAHTELQNMADDELRPVRKLKDRSIGKFTSVLDPGAKSIVKRIAQIPVNKLTHLDMARVVVARAQPKYKAKSDGSFFERDGTTYSGEKDMAYSFDLVLQLEKYGDRRVAVIEKARGMPHFPATIEEFTAEKLLALLPGGKEGFVRKSTPEPVVTKEQADALRAMFAELKLEPGRQSKALQIYGAVTCDDLPAKNYEPLMARLSGMKLAAISEAKT
jgi:hypothetical protein